MLRLGATKDPGPDCQAEWKATHGRLPRLRALKMFAPADDKYQVLHTSTSNTRTKIAQVIFSPIGQLTPHGEYQGHPMRPRTGNTRYPSHFRSVSGQKPFPQRTHGQPRNTLRIYLPTPLEKEIHLTGKHWRCWPYLQ